jgi:ABC-type multidrug transport system ATPase subunit
LVAVTSQPILSAQANPDNLTISAKNLGKRFNREWIFRNLDFQFTPGKTYAITGPNGSGKSTLLQVLWGQVPPSQGTIDYQLQAEKVDPENVFQYISIAAPYMDLIDEFTLREQLAFHFKLKRAAGGLGIDDIIRIGRLEGSENKYIGNFSSGLKQRIKLCIAFYTHSSALFLDEPATNLDEKSFEWYKNELEKSSKTKVVLIASNNSAEYPTDSVPLHLPSFKT